MALLERLQTHESRRSTLEGLPDGVEGVRATLDRMIKIARAASLTDAVRVAAEQATAWVPNKDSLGNIRAVQGFIQNTIHYLPDHATAETLIDPVVLLQSRAGDCDDQSMLVAAMLTSIGFKCRFVAVGTSDVNQFEHVFTEVKLGTGWLSVETTECVDVGWQPEVVARITRHM